MNILIKVAGFLGDTLWASTAALPLILKYHSEPVQVYMQLRFFQCYEVMRLNPHITNVWVGEPPKDMTFDKVFTFGQVNFGEPATIQFQRQCGIENPILEYKVYTNKYYDEVARQMLSPHKRELPVIAYQANWEEKSFLFTEEEYIRGIDIPPLGYGGKRRNINYVLQELSEHYTLLEVGFPSGTPQSEAGGVFTTPIYSMTASLLKYCDYMVGPEGGATYLAAGVGCKTIISGDFAHQLYGWNGVIQKHKTPHYGPDTYFPNDGHITVNPYATDKELVNEIVRIIG